ncbi:MAG: hypothetical protein WD278_14165 [Pirellulales bacterium]
MAFVDDRVIHQQVLKLGRVAGFGAAPRFDTSSQAVSKRPDEARLRLDGYLRAIARNDAGQGFTEHQIGGPKNRQAESLGIGLGIFDLLFRFDRVYRLGNDIELVVLVVNADLDGLF